jgi:hypothetical protein
VRLDALDWQFPHHEGALVPDPVEGEQLVTTNITRSGETPEQYAAHENCKQFLPATPPSRPCR